METNCSGSEVALKARMDGPFSSVISRTETVTVGEGNRAHPPLDRFTRLSVHAASRGAHANESRPLPVNVFSTASEERRRGTSSGHKSGTRGWLRVEDLRDGLLVIRGRA